MRGITSHYQEQDIKSESENQVNQLLNYSSKTILLIHVLEDSFWDSDRALICNMSKQQVCVWHRDEVSMKLSSVTQTRNGSNTNSIPKIKTSFCKICWYVRDCVSNTSFVSFILWVRYEGWWDGSVPCVLENSLMLFCVWERNSLFLSLTFQKFVNSRLHFVCVWVAVPYLITL